MNICILGNGKLGYAVAGKLSEEGHNTVVVDANAEALRASESSQDVFTVCGDALDCDVLSEANTASADLVIATMGSDEQNLIACLLAKKLGAAACIARVRSPEYNKSIQLIREDLGLNFVVNPEFSTAQEISRALRFPNATRVEFFSRGRVEIVEFHVLENSRLIGERLDALGTLARSHVLVCAVQRGDEVIIPHGDFVIEQGDILSVTGSPKNISAFLRRSSHASSQRVSSVMIIGGGKVSYYLAGMLIDSGIQVKIIERDRRRCEELSAMLPKALIVEGDGSNHALLNEEGIDSYDSLVALTGIDEENIVISMYANSRSVRKVVTKINHIPLGRIMQQAGIRSIVTPHVVAAAQILRYVRARDNTQGSHMIALSRIVNDHVDAMEFLVQKGFSGLSVPLKKLRLKKGILIACIIRQGRIIFPAGNDCIEAGDSVILVTTLPGISEMNDILD